MAWVGLFPLIGSILIWTLPESPRWLVQERKENEAAQSLRKLRQSNDIEGELVEMQQEEAATNREELSIMKVLTMSEFRWPLITSLALNAIQQLSGINAVRRWGREAFSPSLVLTRRCSSTPTICLPWPVSRMGKCSLESWQQV